MVTAPRVPNQTFDSVKLSRTLTPTSRTNQDVRTAIFSFLYAAFMSHSVQYHLSDLFDQQKDSLSGSLFVLWNKSRFVLDYIYGSAISG